jgi:hypothetical protein
MSEFHSYGDFYQILLGLKPGPSGEHGRLSMRMRACARICRAQSGEVSEPGFFEKYFLHIT